MTASNMLLSLMAIRPCTNLVRVVFYNLGFLDLCCSIYVYTKDIEQVKNRSHTQLFSDDTLIDFSSNAVNALGRPLSTCVKILAHYLKQKGLVLYYRSTQVIGFHSSCRSPLDVCYASKATASASGGYRREQKEGGINR